MKTAPAAILAKQRSKKFRHHKLKTVAKAAASLGRMGGLSGGPARAAALSDKQRSLIASHAAKIRWGIQSTYRP